ncbi:APC family permease [Streptomyces sp. NPDC001508]|uniref:APC family permease n=1 Tax=Streptomyces sp. NPDC001508 TaxID=3154656 RepID=UPI00331ED814
MGEGREHQAPARLERGGNRGQHLAANLLGVRVTKRDNIAFLIGELIVLATFVGFAIVAISQGVNGAEWTVLPFFNRAEFTPGLIFGAVSVAVLSFLGFDGISTQAEEVEGGRRMVGRATMLCLILVSVLFIVQTYLASLLLPGFHPLAEGSAENQAFYHVAGAAAGHWLEIVTAVAKALGVGLACSLVAQNATSRLLYSMARDGNLPRFLSHVNARTQVPDRAILLVAGVSLALGLGFVGQLELLSTLVNFGALLAFLLLHVSVVSYYLIKRRQRTFGIHLAVPVIGFAVIGYVVANMDMHAKIGGLIWLAIGLAVVLVRKATGRPITLDLSGAEREAASTSA